VRDLERLVHVRAVVEGERDERAVPVAVADDRPEPLLTRRVGADPTADEQGRDDRERDDGDRQASATRPATSGAR